MGMDITGDYGDECKIMKLIFASETEVEQME